MDIPEDVGESRPTPRRFRVTLRALMFFILVLALATTVVVKTLRLREAEVHLQRLRAMAEVERVRAIEARYAAQIAEARARLRMAPDEGSNPEEGEP